MSSNWEVFTDVKSGVKYYANSVTHETTWECPPELADTDGDGGDFVISGSEAASPAEQPIVSPASPTDSTGQASDTQDWSAALDPASQRTYYFNKVTGETRWDAPAGWSEPPGKGHQRHTSELPSQPSGAAAQLAQANSVRTSSSPNLQSTLKVPEPQSPSQPVTNADLWDKVLDPNSQMHYYVNRGSQQSQWEAPPAHLIATHPEPSVTSNGSMGQTSNAYTETKLAVDPNNFSGSSTRETSRASASTGPRHLPTPLAADIQKFALGGFAEQHFRQKKVGFISRKIVPVEDMIRWQSEPITKSLLHSSKGDNSAATSLFKQILTVMGDADSRTRPAVIANKIVNTGVNKPPLRDEIYCQLCKQLTNNPSEESVGRGWRLLASCTASFVPSRAFEDFFKAFVARNFTGQGEVHKYAPFVWWRFRRTVTCQAEEMQYNTVDKLLTNGVPSSMVMFGGNLDYIMELQRQEGCNDTVPKVLTALTSAVLALGGAQTQGMFRIASDKAKKMALREQFIKGDYEVKDDTPHTPGDVLKMWLRELQEPVIPESLYESALALSHSPNEIYPFCVKHLSPDHLATMEYLMLWLRDFAKHSAVTSMAAENLAIVFCQNLLQKRNQDPSKQMSNSEKEKNFLTHAIKVWPERGTGAASP